MASTSSDDSCTDALTVLDQVLPLLLLCDHLTAQDQLACFAVSRAMAEVLLGCMTRTQLLLNLGGAASAGSTSSGVSDSSSGGCGSKGNCGGGNNSAHASVSTAQQLAAQSSNVVLSLHGGLISPAACLWQSITSIHLHGVQLSVSVTDLSSRSQLQLHKLPRLHTLSLQACHVDEDSAPQVATLYSPDLPPAFSIRTLKCVDCKPTGVLQVLLMVLPLVDPGQLQTLITDDGVTATFLLARPLPALQEVQLLPPAGILDHLTLHLLLSQPVLTRVSVPHLRLLEDCSDRACSWASLQLTGGASLEDLASLPLASIQSCTVHSEFQPTRRPSLPPEHLEGAIRNAASCPSLKMEPTMSTEVCGWTPIEPTFHVELYHCTEEQAAKALGLVVRHLTGGALVLSGLHRMSPAVIASLAAAPPTLTTLCVQTEILLGVEQADAVECLTQMPAHISHIILRPSCTRLSIGQWLENVRWWVSGATRPLRLILLQDSLRYTRNSLPEGLEQAVREWLDTRAGNQVQVDCQCRQVGV